MSTVVIDSITAAKFEEQSGEVEVRTPDGRLVGLFTPIREGTPEDYAWARTQFTDEEIQEARESGPGRPLAEILADLTSKYGP
jgi:hypothetical protein